MCGRFTLRRSNEELERAFFARIEVDAHPRFNIAPTQDVLAIRESPASGQREGVLMHWGLIPPWASDAKIGGKMINARAETLKEKRSFQQPLAKRRCLILADGFYEWRETPTGKQPYFIHRQDDRPFAFAGLWEVWKKSGQPVESCAIITTAANEVMQPLHHRMPVIVPSDSHARWLDGTFADGEQMLSPAASYNWREMEIYAVSKQVNKASYDRPDCIARLS